MRFNSIVIVCFSSVPFVKAMFFSALRGAKSVEQRCSTHAEMTSPGGELQGRVARVVARSRVAAVIQQQPQHVAVPAQRRPVKRAPTHPVQPAQRTKMISQTY